MTIVELFDSTPINNIIGALAYRPERIIYIGGFSEKQFVAKKYPALRKYFDSKNLSSMEICYVQVNKESLQEIVDTLEDLYENNTDCKFNIEVTGGEDLVLVGIGVMCQRYPDLQLIKISSKLRNITSCSLSEAGKQEKISADFFNTVRQNMLLHGADIISSNEEYIEEWETYSDLQERLEFLWNVCCCGIPDFNYDEYVSECSYPGAWNRVISALAEMDYFTCMRPEQNIICINEEDYIDISGQYCNVNIVDRYLEYLMYNGFLETYTENKFVTIEFKDDMARSCLTKSGNLLEIKTYLACRNLLGSCNGDVRTGVTIDWDGKMFDREDLYHQGEENTVNEIDVIGMYGLVPYFISCKNGKFTSEELYKLNTVAERFGTGYCSKIIVTTDLKYAVNNSEEALLQRALDMGIKIIDNVHEMSSEEFSSALSKAMELPKQKIHI